MSDKCAANLMIALLPDRHGRKPFPLYLNTIIQKCGGDLDARHNLGVNEYNRGNMDWVLKHYMIGAGSGYTAALEQIKHIFMNRYATKDD